MSPAEDLSRSSAPVRKLIVAIDGPSGAGKSTLARHLADHFGLLNLETGAMYRAFGLKALRAHCPVDDPQALELLSADTTIHLEPGEWWCRLKAVREDRKSTRLNSSHSDRSRMPSSA